MSTACDGQLSPTAGLRAFATYRLFLAPLLVARCSIANFRSPFLSINKRLIYRAADGIPRSRCPGNRPGTAGAVVDGRRLAHHDDAAPVVCADDLGLWRFSGPLRRGLATPKDHDRQQCDHDCLFAEEKARQRDQAKLIDSLGVGLLNPYCSVSASYRICFTTSGLQFGSS